MAVSCSPAALAAGRRSGMRRAASTSVSTTKISTEPPKKAQARRSGCGKQTATQGPSFLPPATTAVGVAEASQLQSCMWPSSEQEARTREAEDVSFELSPREGDAWKLRRGARSPFSAWKYQSVLAAVEAMPHSSCWSMQMAFTGPSRFRIPSDELGTPLGPPAASEAAAKPARSKVCSELPIPHTRTGQRPQAKARRFSVSSSACPG
mmetsp:Transcript_40535/g.73435  ORF Transcript_40535/g.73435 Transcript_40535/m.73435 type:complete len:208 (+) Transcript_40535:996-1619(+)